MGRGAEGPSRCPRPTRRLAGVRRVGDELSEMSMRRRLLATAMILAAAIGGSAATGAMAEEPLDAPSCAARTLIVTAMPLELNPIIRNSTTDATDQNFM